MAKERILKGYNGPLTPAQAAKGIQVAMKNASALFLDAELLLENQRWQRAAAIAILAIEEAGKPSQLRGLLLAKDEAELREEWRDYRSHTKKNLMWIFPFLAKQGAEHLEEFQSIFAEESDHGQTLEALKQIALYSDAYGNCHWSLPEEVMDKELAKTLVEIAKLYASKEQEAMTSEQELEIWVKHMRPVWKSDMADMKRALLAAYAEAHALGVLQGGTTPSDMVKFIL